MSNRMLADSKGCFDLTQVLAITPASNKYGPPQELKERVTAVLHFTGGQVVNTDTEMTIAVKLWQLAVSPPASVEVADHAAASAVERV